MVKLGSIVEIISGFPFKSASFLDDDKQVPLVKGENLQPGYIDWSKSRYWSAVEYEQLQKYHLMENDVVVAMDRPWVPAGLKWAYIKKDDPKSLLVQRVARLRTKDADILDQIFLRYLISSESFSKYIEPIVTGTNVPHISAKQIGDFKFQLPHIDTQRLIGKFLSDYDVLISNNSNRLKILKKIVDALYQEWFINFKFPNHEQVNFVDGIPEGWSLKSVQELTELISRGITPKYNDESGLSIVINQKCIRDKKLNLELARRQDKEIPASKLVQQGDVLINSTGAGTLGRVTQVHEDLPKTTVDTHVTIVRPLKEISTAWFGAAISNLESYIETLGEGATNQLELKREVIGRLDLVCPTMEIQQEFQKIVEPMQQQILNLMKQNMHLVKLKDTLLPRLMSGELDVSKPSSIE